MDGAQQALPFAVSNPVLYYNKQSFTAAGLNPTRPPATLTQFAADAQVLKAHGSGAALVLDAWHLETWLATANKLFVNNGNGRVARTTEAVFVSPAALRIWTTLDKMVASGAAVTNPSSGPDAYDNLLGMGTGKFGMTIDSSADLGTITKLLGTHHNVTLGVGPFPVYSSKVRGGVEPGGSALFISDKVPAAQEAAAWTFETYLDSTASQAVWAAGTGYIPVRRSSVRTPRHHPALGRQPGLQGRLHPAGHRADHPGHQRRGHRPVPDSAQRRDHGRGEHVHLGGVPGLRPADRPVAGRHSHLLLQSAGRYPLSCPCLEGREER